MTDPDTVWDAIIIGAGPAGSMFALALSRRRLKVLLLDQARFPRSKVCGGCLNSNALAAFKTMGLSQVIQKLGGLPIHQLQLNAQGRAARIALDTGLSLSREILDHALVQSAVEAGATFQSGVRATMKECDEAIRRVELHRDTGLSSVTARVVILAHGLKAGTVTGNSWIGAGLVMNDAPADAPRHTISMAVGRGGYVGGVHVECGRYDLAAALDPQFVKDRGGIGHAVATIRAQAGLPTIPDIASAHWKGTPSLTRRPTAIAGPRWFAVGDAAGYVEPFTGEGTACAPRCARNIFGGKHSA